MKYAGLMQHIYNAIFTNVCKVSLQRKNKPGRNWISNLTVDNQKQISPYIYEMILFLKIKKEYYPILSIRTTKKLNFPGLISSQIPNTIWKTNSKSNHLGLISSQIHHTISKTYLTQNFLVILIYETIKKINHA